MILRTRHHTSVESINVLDKDKKSESEDGARQYEESSISENDETSLANYNIDCVSLVRHSPAALCFSNNCEGFALKNRIIFTRVFRPVLLKTMGYGRK